MKKNVVGAVSLRLQKHLFCRKKEK